MKLYTEVILPDYPFQLGYEAPIMLMGSCFTENIGKMLEKYLFPVCVNPFGVTYNPMSVQKGLEALIKKDLYREDDLDHYNHLWFSFDHYTGFSSPDRDESLKKINESFREAKGMLQAAKFLVITWGTAWVYRYNDTGNVVCNCHKIPASQFTRTRLTTREIIQSYETFLPTLFEFNKEVKILLTVSPVRHWKDGAHGNQLSKATLLLGQEALLKLFPEQLYYFPSYEIVMDELRDYRFFAQDLLHTNDLATTYIWDKFSHTFFSEGTQEIIRELNPLLQMMEHRSLIQKGAAYQDFLEQREEKLHLIREKYPFLAWKKLRDEIGL